MTRAEMLERMSARELSEWMAYERVTGTLGAERGDATAALTAYHIVQALGAKKVKPDQLMPKWDRKPAQDWQHMKLVAQALAKASGGEFRKQ